MDVDPLADDIYSSGIKMVFGIPGSGDTLSLIDALEKRGIQFCRTFFEGTGVLMAATIGRLSGKPGVSLSIKGPGLANAVPGLAVAYLESLPVVHLTEAYPFEIPAFYAHKRLEHKSLVNAITKGIHSLSKHGTGFREISPISQNEEPGPVVLELIESPEDGIPMPDLQPITGGGEQVVDLIKQAERPVVIAGTLAIRQGWGKALAKLNIPVFSTAAAKGIIDETLSHAAGVFTGQGGELTPEYNIIPTADLVVALGLSAREVLVTQPFPCKAVNVTAVPTSGSEGFCFTSTAGMYAAEEVLESLSDKEWEYDHLVNQKNHLKKYLLKKFLPGQVFECVNNHFNGQVRAVMDTGYFCTIGEHAWEARSSDLCLLSGQSRYMGTALPMALAASMYDRSIPTVAFLGDGGIGMYLAEATIAVRYNLPLLIILMSDNAYGSLRTRAIRDGLTQSPLIMDETPWTEIFSAMGIPGIRAESLEDVKDALSGWNQALGPAFLEIHFDPDLYEAMVRGIR